MSECGGSLNHGSHKVICVCFDKQRDRWGVPPTVCRRAFELKQIYVTRQLCIMFTN